LRPVIDIKGGKVTIGRIFTGEMDECYQKYIDFILPRNVKPDLDVAIVDYISLTEEEKEIVKRSIRKRHNFEHILFQKVSSVMSLNCGRGAMGIMYLLKKDEPYGLSQILSNALYHGEGIKESEYIDTGDNHQAVPEPEEVYEEKKAWYEEIPGIDSKKAMENSGSEEAFKSVLQIFYDSLDQRILEIEDLYASENWKDYTIKVHALKSSSRLIGAMSLGDEAEKLEMAGKNDDTDYIRNNNESFVGRLKEYKNNMAFFCNSKKDEDEHFDRILIKSAYDTIRKAAEERNDRMIEMTLRDISEYDIPDKHQDKMNRIEVAFERQDYEEIKMLSDITEDML
jgi:HPt (histidine-containing phosphotransfer) domain-containing protein